MALDPQARGLIDQMAQAHSLYLNWVEKAHLQASLDGTRVKKQLGEAGKWQARTLGVAETLDQSAQMLDRRWSTSRCLLEVLVEQRYRREFVVEFHFEVGRGALRCSPE